MPASASSNPSLSATSVSTRALLMKVVAREHLTRAEASALFSFVLDPATTDAQIAAVLAAFATKIETADELAGMADVMRARATRIECSHTRFIDTAGTGGSAAKSFNVSTAAAFVIAGAGLPVAKHGNRAVSSMTGSADVFTALGVNITAPPHIMERCLNDIGICFLFAPTYHPACARAASVRREMGISTAFNCLGPMCNPACAPYQIVGVPLRSREKTIAETIAELGTTRSWVVTGVDGLDEISIGDATHVFEITGNSVAERWIEPADFGLIRSRSAIPQATDANKSADVIRGVLRGEAGPARQIVVVNTAAALYIAGVAKDLREGVTRAEASLDSGAAQKKLDALVRATTGGVA